MRFSRAWGATGQGPYGLGEVYNDETYGKLPPLPEQLLNGTFDWLIPEAAGRGSFYMAPGPVPLGGLDALNRRLAWHGLALPAAFERFMASSVLQASVPSCTACEWENSPRLVASPIEDHAFMLRFMKDQQGCGYWYLYLGSDGLSPVVGSASRYEAADDEPVKIAPASFLADVRWMAPDFEHFVYRYWIENVAWFGLVSQKRDLRDLNPVVRQYVNHLQAPAGSPLDCWPTPFPAARGGDHGQDQLW
ncbi:hypothetical protein AB0B83_29045 [Micromonospora sp. NPDC049060]|uniref:hypothetical protein n=1 Tax=Micromonospora sp. NPDC049060 TaxID=3154828 RepID=UPI0033FC615E